MKKEVKENNYSFENKMSKEKDISQLIIGFIILSVGLFMLSKRVIVHSGWYTWRVGYFNLSSGTIIIPLIIGVIWFFVNSKSILAKGLIVLSMIFIVVSIIMSVSLQFVSTSLFDYLLIFVLIAAGTGLLLKFFLRKVNKFSNVFKYRYL